MVDSSEEIAYVYLEFNEKLAPTMFANKMFLRVANLHKPNPLVQINDLVFKGTYDECVGTNLFFEEIEDPPLRTNIFEKDTPIRLKHVVSQTKLIKLKQMKLPKKVTTNKKCKESVVLNLNHDYNTVLEKLEQGLLHMEDLSVTETPPSMEEPYDEMVFETDEEVSTESEKEVDSILGMLNNKTPINTLEAKYERLKRLVRRPVKRMKSPELVAECEPPYKESYEYHNLERQVCQSSDAFRSTSAPIIDKTFVGSVDIDRCVLHGLLAASPEINRTLTKEEINKVFTVDNLENLSIPARYLVLKESVAKIEELIEGTSSEELKETDENGRTIKDICDIFRKLVKALENIMQPSSVNIKIKTKAQINEDDPEQEYLTYKPNSRNNLATSYCDIFNVEDWTDGEEAGKSGLKQENDSSGDEESDE